MKVQHPNSNQLFKFLRVSEIRMGQFNCWSTDDDKLFPLTSSFELLIKMVRSMMPSPSCNHPGLFITGDYDKPLHVSRFCCWNGLYGPDYGRVQAFRRTNFGGASKESNLGQM
ncbi:hypothetical protein L596_016669 [Steinernema carpocapsae]|uniref:Uncharacterized protein n=1 Tax=Steinernema carpocapsae TaxID=34508 RepID=A0A4U5NJI7_STECR|nr:hypothetical protein L596_016669 [Steinernema carpocapsae]